MINFRTNKYYLLILLAAFIVGGCGDFSGNYDEIESSASSESTGSANGTGTSASFYNPRGITTDGTNLYVADNSNHLIRKIE